MFQGEAGGEVGGDDSYLDDFEALLADNSAEVRSDCDEDKHCDIEADFDALIEKENVLIEEQIESKSENKISQGENIKEDPRNENKQEESDDKESDLGGTDNNDEPLDCDENINEESSPANQSEETEHKLSKPVIERSRSLSGDLDEQEERTVPNLEVANTDQKQQQLVVKGEEVADNCEHNQVATMIVLTAWLVKFQSHHNKFSIDHHPGSTRLC